MVPPPCKAHNANWLVIEHGLGLQAADVPLPSLVMIGKAIYGDEIVYVVVLAVIKIAILVMYCRMFPVRRFKIAAWVLGILTVVWSVMFIFICKYEVRRTIITHLTSTRHISVQSDTACLEFDHTWQMCKSPSCLHRKRCPEHRD